MFLTSHTSIQWPIIPTEIPIKIKLWSFHLCWWLRLFLLLLLLMMLLLMFLLLLLLLVLFVIIFLLVMFILVLGDFKLLLNFMYQSGHFLLRDLVLFQNVRMLEIKLFSNLHWVWVQNKSLQYNRIDFLLSVGLFVLVVNTDDWWLVTYT